MEERPYTYGICRICFWEDDGLQFTKPIPDAICRGIYDSNWRIY
ncbi:hypothetical protein B1B04_05550 [Lysinibacillus sp. KCTC 33748]|nr:hypothetical protein B1B04_05550 [Lysinibacillus sp. KCTC 33748]